MKKLALKIGFLAFVYFAVAVLLGDKMNVFYNLFPNPEEARDLMMTGSVIIVFASLGLIVVRTILGILTILVLAVLVFLALKMNLIDIILQNIN